MFNRKLWFVINCMGLSLVLFGTAKADYPKKCPEVKELAKTFIEMEFHGRRSPEHHSCLKKVKSTAVWVRPEQVDEAMKKAPKVSHWVDSLKDLKVGKVSKTKVNERYKVEFSYKVAKQTIEDFIILETYEGTMKKMVGCAAIVQAPQKLSLLTTCK